MWQDLGPFVNANFELLSSNQVILFDSSKNSPIMFILVLPLMWLS